MLQVVRAEHAVSGYGRMLARLERRQDWILPPPPIEVVVAARREPSAKASEALEVGHREGPEIVGFQAAAHTTVGEQVIAIHEPVEDPALQRSREHLVYTRARHRSAHVHHARWHAVEQRAVLE